MNYSKEDIEKIQKLILGRLLNTSSPPSFDEKDRLVEDLKAVNEITEREINNLVINN